MDDERPKSIEPVLTFNEGVFGAGASSTSSRLRSQLSVALVIEGAADKQAKRGNYADTNADLGGDD